MAEQDSKIKEYYETLSQNALRGDTYLIKFRDDNIVYEGIPMLRSSLSSEDDETLTLDVLKPEDKKGIIHRSIRDIELLKER
ncbi:MAG: hypothetical protein P8184_04555 [Calditrichia bacterium]